MRLKFIRGLTVLFLSIGLLILIPGISFSGQDKEEPTEDQTYPEKRKSEEIWEAILSFPGKVIFFPFKLLFGGIGTAAAAIDEGNVVQKVVDTFTSDDGRRSIHPVYSARTGGGPKFYQEDFLFSGSKLKLQATLGPRYRQKYKAVLQDIQLRPSLNLEFQSSFLIYPDEQFFGLGNDSQLDDVSNFAHKRALVDLTLHWRISEKASLFSLVGYEYDHIGEGRNTQLPSLTGLYPRGTPSLPGLDQGLDFGRAEILFLYDGKSHPGRPTGGSEVVFQSSLHRGLGDNGYGFWKASFEATQYLHLFYGRTLVFRLAGKKTDAFQGDEIPFYHRSGIGESGTVRGFKRGRFIGKDMLLGSLEYRYPVWTFFDAVLFLDAGKVSDKNIFDNLSFNNLHYGYGGGLRIWAAKGPVAKFEFAWSEDGYRFYFEIYTAF